MCPDDLKLSQYKKETLQYKKESDLVIGLERFNFALSHHDKTLCSHVLESAVRTDFERAPGFEGSQAEHGMSK